MPVHVSMIEFFDAIKNVLGESVSENSTLDEISVSVEDFIDFLFDNFDFASNQENLIRNNVHSDSLFFDIYNSIFM